MFQFKYVFKVLASMFFDAFFVNLSFYLALVARFDNYIPRKYMDSYYGYSVVFSLVVVFVLLLFRLYSSIWDYAGLDEFSIGAVGCIVAGMLLVAFTTIESGIFPRSVVILGSLFSAMFVMGVRVLFRMRRSLVERIKGWRLDRKNRIMIVGAGSAGRVIVREIQTNPHLGMHPVCFIDDDPLKRGKRISGIKVLGGRNDISRLVDSLKIDQIVIAIPTLEGVGKRELIEVCQKNSCKLKIIPGIFELINGNVSVSRIRDINIEDLLGREAVVLEQEGINRYLHNKTVFISGAGGSIGSEIARQVIRFSPSRLILLDIYENSIYDIQNELLKTVPDLALFVRIGSIRDRNRIDSLFKEFQPDVIFHAAAHKHVPLMEDSPSEAIKNNVIGTLNLAEMADKYHVKKFVMISTDKAVNPTNVMGASKRMCEMIIQAIASRSTTKFGAVRFGNVLGSNGSVIPLFKKQIASGGPVTVTHKEITRFFMTIPEAAQLVLQAGAYATGGQIFILDMGSPVKIYDLAENLIRLSGFTPDHDIKIKITGLRPGEKLYEEVLMHEEGMGNTRHKKIFIAKPSQFNLDVLKVEFQQLIEICEAGSRNEIIKKIIEIVPTYYPSSSELSESVPSSCVEHAMQDTVKPLFEDDGNLSKVKLVTLNSVAK